MLTVNALDYRSNLTDLFRETFEGSGGGGSHYIDGRSRGSFLETLSGVDHVLASTPLTSGGATIAAHTEHTRYYLRTLRRFIDLEGNVQTDWPGSWRIRDVTALEWLELKLKLEDEYRATLAHLERMTTWDDEPIGGFLSMLAHSAYHLGAVRLIAVTLRSA